MARRSTIGDNPLDAVIPSTLPSTPPSPAAGPGDAGPASPSSAAARPARTRVKKERLTVHLPVALIDRIKNAVFWTPGLTLAGLAEEALGQAVDALEAQRGEPFPPRTRELTGGRPLK